jgi:hypothetical protein
MCYNNKPRIPILLTAECVFQSKSAGVSEQTGYPKIDLDSWVCRPLGGERSVGQSKAIESLLGGDFMANRRLPVRKIKEIV